MKANLHNSEHAKASFEIIVDKETLSKAEDNAYKKNRKTFNIPGFRKGKVPRKVIEAHYGKDIFLYDAIDDLFPEVYTQAVQDLELDIMSKPILVSQTINDNGELVLEIEVATLPVVTLPDYRSFTFESELPKVTEEDVQKELEQQVVTFPIKKPAETVTEDNVVEFDLDTYTISDSTSTLISRESGLNKGLSNLRSINNEQLTEQLIGKKTGDIISINYDSENNPVEQSDDLKRHDRILITDVYEVETPEIDDEFVKSISFYDTVEEYKEFLEDILANEKNQYFVVNEYPKLLSKLLTESEVEFSDIYEKEIEDEIKQDQNSLAPFLQFIYEKTDPEKSPSENYLNFIKDLSVLEEVADEMGYQITNDDLMKELDYLSQTSLISTVLNQLDPTEARMVLHYSALNRLIASYLAQIATQNSAADQADTEVVVEEDNA